MSSATSQTPKARPRRRWLRRLALVCAVPIVLLATLYFGRRLFFESLIVDELQTALAPILGADIRGGSLRGGWLQDAEYRVETVTGRDGSAYRSAKGLRIRAKYSPTLLFEGEFAGLRRVDIHADQIALDLDGAFVGTTPDATGSDFPLEAILAACPEGLSLRVDELALQPEYAARRPFVLKVHPGTGKRKVEIEFGDAKLTGSATPQGNFDLNGTSQSAGRLLQALGVRGADRPEGPLTVDLAGQLDPWQLRVDLHAAATIGTDRPVTIAGNIDWREGRIRAKTLGVDLPGLRLAGRSLDIPVGDLTPEAFRALVRAEMQGSLTAEITDLTPYRKYLPAAVKRLLPITGNVALALERGVVQLRESKLESPGLKVQGTAGSFSLLQLPPGALTADTLWQAAANDLALDVTLTTPLRVDIPGGEPLVLQGKLNGTLGGSLAAPNVSVRVDLQRTSFREFQCAAVAGDIQYDGKTVTVDNLDVRNFQRTADGFAASATGSARVDLEPDLRVVTDVQGTLPAAALTLAGIPADVLNGLQAIQGKVVSDATFGDAWPVGTLDVDLPAVRYRNLPPVQVRARTKLTADAVAFDELALSWAQGTYRATGRVTATEVDLRSSGRIDDLAALAKGLQLPDLAGRLVLRELRLVGPFASPDGTLDGDLTLSKIDPTWFPEGRRQHLPTPPLTLGVKLASTAGKAELQSFALGYGNTNRRLDLRANGPLPIWFRDGKFASVATDKPLVAGVTLTAEQTVFERSAVNVSAKILLDAEQIQIPNLLARSLGGVVRGRDLGLSLSIRELLDEAPAQDRIAALKRLPIRGNLEIENFEFGGILSGLLTGGRVKGNADGKFVASGSVTAPVLDGSLAIRGGVIRFGDAADFHGIEVDVKLDKRRASLDCRAIAGEDRKFTITAALDGGPAGLLQSSLDRTLPIGGQLQVRGFELASVPRRYTGLDRLYGLLTADCALAGSWQDPRPSVNLKIDRGGFQSPELPEVEKLSVDLSVAPDRVHIRRCHATVRNVPFDLTGDVRAPGARLWNLAATPQAPLTGRLTFNDFPLPMIPPSVSAWQDLAGIVEGEIEFGGTVTDPRPNATLHLKNAAAKFAAFPRIENLKSRLTADHRSCTIIASGTLGAAPVGAKVAIRAGDGGFLASWRTAKVDARIEGKRLLLIRRGGLKLRGEVDLAATGPIDAIKVTGAVTLQKGSKFVKRLSLVPDLKTQGGASSGDTFGPWSIPGGERLSFDVKVTTQQPLEVRTNVFDSRLRLNCRILGQGDSIYPAGVCLTDSGILRVPGMTMRLQNMRLEFHEENPTRPVILATASGRRHGIRINMRVKGYWDDPIINLASTPALPPKEVWSLITTGKRPETLEEDGAQSNTALIATYILQELLLTYFSSESTEEEEGFVSRFTFEFGREISRGGEETWQVDMDLGGIWVVPRNFGVQLERDVYEDINLGFVYRWRF